MTRYFEDVAVDEELEPVKRIASAEQSAYFFGRPDESPRRGQSMTRNVADEQGAPIKVVPGPLKMAWISKFVTDWAGHDGEIVTVRCAFRRVDVVGHPVTLAGRVVDKRVEDGRHLIQLDVVTLREGQPTAQGFVELALPSRTSEERR